MRVAIKSAARLPQLRVGQSERSTERPSLVKLCFTSLTLGAFSHDRQNTAHASKINENVGFPMAPGYMSPRRRDPPLAHPRCLDFAGIRSVFATFASNLPAVRYFCLKTACWGLKTACQALKTACQGLKTACQAVKTACQGLETAWRDLKTAWQGRKTASRSCRTACRGLKTACWGLKTACRNLKLLAEAPEWPANWQNTAESSMLHLCSIHKRGGCAQHSE
jgi:hypothetical protein